MHLLVSRRLLVNPQPHLPHQRCQLMMHVAPLTQPALGQELFAQLLGKLSVRLPMLDGLLKVMPHLEQRQKIGLFVVKAGVRPVSSLGPFVRTLPWIVYFEHCGDDQDFRQAMLVLGRKDHACDARIDRETREPPTERGQSIGFIDRPQLGK